jgi:glycosyltransferase involved in cell wall biosynthesis
MKLLITTQAVDLDDPVLAFFHRWIEEFAKNAEHVHVICLKEGRHNLPKNVSVHSLGKPSSAKASKGKEIRLLMRVKYIFHLYRYVFSLRKEYDTVFVHMNPEYLVTAGWLWKKLGKKVSLWYIHPKVSPWLEKGMKHVDVVFSASEESFPLKSTKLIPTGLGVDTNFFSPAPLLRAVEMRLMCTARIAPVKRVECIIDAVAELSRRSVPVMFDYYGEELPRDKEYADSMRKRAEPISIWNFRGKASFEAIRDAYRTHDVHINATDTGSFDKAVFEGMACGCITIASNKALKNVLPRELIFDEGDAKSLANAIEKVVRLPEEDKRALSEKMRKLAVERYSLEALIMRIFDTFTRI